jgi:hypothetical protein
MQEYGRCFSDLLQPSRTKVRVGQVGFYHLYKLCNSQTLTADWWLAGKGSSMLERRTTTRAAPVLAALDLGICYESRVEQIVETISETEKVR